jgi:hypothetical protein
MINTNKPTLHLVIKKTWFDMIFSGEKLVEYREIKEYYGKLFACGQIKIGGIYYDANDVNICFHLGKGKNRPTMLIECEGLSIGYGNPNWGANHDKPYYRLDLGKILFVTNYSI